MKNLLAKLTLGLVAVTGAFSAENAAIQCRAHVPNGHDLIFNITDTGGATFGHNNSLFGGVGEGHVTVHPVLPAKMLYPLHFNVQSAGTKRYRMNVFPATIEGNLVFSVLADDPNSEDYFKATIRYGNAGLTFRGQCYRFN